MNDILSYYYFKKMNIHSNIKKIFFILLILLIGLNTHALTQDQYELIGVNGDILKNIEARLASISLSSQKISEQKISQIKEIKLALQPYGYFHPLIHTRLIYQNKRPKWLFNIALGEPMRVNKIDIKLIGPGKNNTAINKFIADFPIKKGDIFNVENYHSAKNKLFEIATNEGYIHSFLQKNEILLDTKTNKMTIVFSLDTKDKYYFGNITFSNNKYHPDFLKRFFNFKEPQNFSSQELIKMQQRVEQANYFNKVIITPEFNQAVDHRIPLKVIIIPPKSQKYSLGLGYGTFTKARISSAVSFRNFNNIGHTFDAKLNFSSVISNIIAQYSIPGTNPLTEKWNMGIKAQIFTPQRVSTRSMSIFSGYETKHDKVKTAGNLTYLVEKYKFENLPRQVSKLLYPQINIDYVDANDLINPSSGKAISLSLAGSLQQLLSSTSFLQSELKLKTILPIYTSRLIIKSDIGYSIIHKVKTLPASLYFYAGTLNGLRGYPQSSEGPGRYLVIGSAEYQVQIKGDWSGALFYDMGRAGNHFSGLYRKATGVGVIYHSVIGPIRVYVAHALNRRGRANSIELNIGPEF